MRTTLTLDDQLMRRLKDRMQATGSTFRETVESVLRLGLAAENITSSHQPFQVQARPMGLKAGIDPARLQDFEGDLEVERFLHVTDSNKTNG